MPIKEAAKKESRPIDLYSILPIRTFASNYCNGKTGKTILKWHKQGKLPLIYLSEKTVLAVLPAPEERHPKDTSTRYWPLKFVSARLEVTDRTVKNWALKGCFTIEKHNRAYLVDKNSFHAWINKLKEEQNET